jgi:type IV pilus assembly protein PilB
MSKRSLIGTILLGQHLISRDQLEECLNVQKKLKDKLGQILVKKGYVYEKDLVKSLAIQEHFPIVPIDASLIDAEVTALVSLPLAKKYVCMPLQRQKDALTLAMADPLDLQAIQDIRFHSGLEINPVFATRDEILETIRYFYETEKVRKLPFLGPQGQVDHLEYGPEDSLDTEAGPGVGEMGETSLAPVIRMQNLIIEEALRTRSSDIHIEPRAKFVQIRNRVDGWLMDTIQVPKWMQDSLVSRLKILANMDISEKRLPQDASFRVRKDSELIDLRVSTLPTKYGEKMVIRILDKSRGLLSLKDLGFSSKQHEQIKSLIEKPQGLILVVGPTGSGKTTTLYSMVNAIKSEALNIITLEDPVEYELEGINQVQIHEKTGLTFATTLRSILRQDPDVILVGEIRDLETATIAFRAAFTGHLVLSTLHTNDTVSTVTRLYNMGIEPYVIASSLLGIISQRLVRRNCPQCREPYDPPEEILEKFPLSKKLKHRFYRGKGCSTCNHKGYLGREGFYEVLIISQRLREAITQKASEQTLRKLAIEQGMVPMLTEGLRKAKKGMATLEEIVRVIATTQEPLQACPKCGETLDSEFLICPFCETTISRKCFSCHRILQLEWQICPYCGRRPLEAPPRYEELTG